MDVAGSLRAIECRCFCQRGVFIEYRAAVAVRLFRYRIRQEAAAASLVSRHRGTILSVLATHPDVGRPDAPWLSGGGDGHRAIVLCAQHGADRFEPNSDLLPAVHPCLGIA